MQIWKIEIWLRLCLSGQRYSNDRGGLGYSEFDKSS